MIQWKPGMVLANASGDVDPTTLGYQFTIQTTTALRAKVVEQKFYEVAPGDFLPIEMGNGAWMESIVTPRTFDLAGDFEQGITNVAGGSARIAEVDVALDSVNTPVATWVKGYRYTVPELSKALASMNWNPVESKNRALKRNWDLGIQKLAFLGLKSNSAFAGLLTQSAVTIDTTTITENISAMDSANYQALVATILYAYANNNNFTELPDMFVMPMADYLGMGAAASADFPMISKLDYLLKAFRQLTQNEGFQIKPLAYADKARNVGFTDADGVNRYVLYKRDPENLLLNIPVNFVMNAPGTANNFQWEGVAVGQFTGVALFRPASVLYFDHE